MAAKIVEFIKRAEKLYDSGVSKPEFKAWRDDVIRFLKKKYGNNSHEAASFEKIEFYNMYLVVDVIDGQFIENKNKVKDLFNKELQTAILYLKNYESDDNSDSEEKQNVKTNKTNNENVFIVHGRNDGVKAEVANFLLKLGIKPIVLHEQTNRGQTIIEKFEKHSDVKAAIILFTCDDLGKYKDDSKLEKRARQNVIFEAGYFIGKLGRENTIILLEDGLKIPSDLDGYTYIEIDKKQSWELALAKELKGLGFNIDMNNLV
jgi:predicted nucleotide-binding protein